MAKSDDRDRGRASKPRRRPGAGDRKHRGREPRPAPSGFGPFGKPDDRSGERSRAPARRDDQRDRRDSESQPGRRAPFRVVRGETVGRTAKRRGTRDSKSDRAGARRAPRRRRETAGGVREEMLRLGGARGARYYEALMDAAAAFRRERARDALRILRPLREALPESPGVRELLGLVHYRLGHYPAAAKELEAFADLTGSVEQHPVLMDCYRAQRRWRRVESLWRELTAASPGPELVTEGRIVAAGALADRGRLDAAIDLLKRGDRRVPQPALHHLRLWYALADLEERSGNLPRARALFTRVRRRDAGFADTAERLATLA